LNKPNPIPPPFAKRLLTWFLRDDLAEEVHGDLDEKFYCMVKDKSLFRAQLNYGYQVLNYIRPFAFRKSTSTNSNTMTMVRHNFTITYRNFKRYKSSFFINLIGLSSGLASVLLIYLWVADELSMDKFHQKDKQLYQVMRHGTFGDDEIHTTESNSDLLAPALDQELAEIEYVVPVAGPFGHGILSAGEVSIKATDKFAGKDFFNVFSYKLILGDKDRVLSDKYSIVISDELAVKLFGTIQTAVGKSITWDEEAHGGTYIVSGIFEKARQSSEQFDFLLTIEMFLSKRPPGYINWDSNSSSAYVILKEGVDIAQFNTKLNNFYWSKLETMYGKEHPEWISTMFLRHYSDRYLYDRYENGVQAGGRIEYVVLFSTVALFILVIACINFMNLSTARASRRLKEIGIKKSIGAQRGTLVFQYLSESMFLAFLSLAVALIVAFLFLPQFNTITGKSLALALDYYLILGTLAITFFAGLVSGSYPAFFLSGFRPAEVLKGKLAISFSEVWARKGLVVFQFCISILLIVSVVVVYRQIDFVQSKNLGYDKNNVIVFDKQGKLNGNLESFLTEARAITGVLKASSMDYEVGRPSVFTSGVSWDGKHPADKSEFAILDVGYGLIETLGFEFAMGRPFSEKFNTENSKLICNKEAVRYMHLIDPIGKSVKLWGKEYEIIGVVNDFHFESLFQPVKPCFFKLSNDNHKVAVKILSGTERETLSRLGKLYLSFNPGIPFDFKFLDDEYDALYRSEQRVADLSLYFAGIAILISCLGLFGLAAFTAERRMKEIGIRKILGSGEFRIVYLLSSDFTKMVLVAIAIVLPVSYFIAREWLGRFAYRIDLEWWYFVGAGLAALFIAWLTVGVQAVKAANINPTQCLRSE